MPSGAAGRAGPPKTPEVLVDLPTTGEITDFEDFTGRTMATKTIEIRPRVTGYLKTINFKDKRGATSRKDSCSTKSIRGRTRPKPTGHVQICCRLVHVTAGSSWIMNEQAKSRQQRTGNHAGGIRPRDR